MVGLKSDGTVIAQGKNHYLQCEVSSWKKVTAISAGVYHTVGLKEDGTVYAQGREKEGQCNVSHWKDVIQVDAGELHTVAVFADGTVDAVGSNSHSQCDVQDWTDIIAISAGEFHTIGLKRMALPFPPNPISRVSTISPVGPISSKSAPVINYLLAFAKTEQWLQSDGTTMDSSMYSIGHKPCSPIFFLSISIVHKQRCIF